MPADKQQQQQQQQQQQKQQQQPPTSIDTSNLYSHIFPPPGPTSPQLEKDAARAISHTDSWKPALARRVSYQKEDHKHELQMRASGVGASKVSPGFTEGSE